MQDGKKFIVCLHEMTNEEENARGIGFSACGTLVEIRDPDFLCQTVLPKYFRHSNLRSLVRQLNNYGFASRPTKMHVAQCFYHQLFIRGRLDLTDQIRRKTSATPSKPQALPTTEPSYVDNWDEDSVQYQAALVRNSALQQRHAELLARIRVLEEGFRQPQPPPPPPLLTLSPLNSNFASFFSNNKTNTPSHLFGIRNSGEQQQFFPSVVRSSAEQQSFWSAGNSVRSSGEGGVVLEEDMLNIDLMRSLQWRQSMESADERL